MAYDSRGLDPGASSAGAPAKSRYITTDAAATVEGASYFDSAFGSLHRGGAATSQGTILCEMSDELTEYGYTATLSTGVILLATATKYIYIT